MRYLMTNRGTVNVETTCPFCLEQHWVEMSLEQYQEWYGSPDPRHIQEVFDGHSEADRELILTGTCKPCWDEFLPEDDE